MLLVVLLAVNLLPVSVLADFQGEDLSETVEIGLQAGGNSGEAGGAPADESEFDSQKDTSEETDFPRLTAALNKGETNLLEAIEVNNKTYVLQVEPGDYWVDGYSIYNGKDYKNGGLSITVAETGSNYTFGQIYDFRVENSQWGQGTDYSVTAAVTDSMGKARAMEMGKADSGSGERLTCLFAVGDTIEVTFQPEGEKAEIYKASAKVDNNYAKYMSVTFHRTYELTVTALEGSTIAAGKFSRYYTYDFTEPYNVKEENGVKTAFFQVEDAHGYIYGDSEYHFVRVQHPDGVTYWGFGLWNQNGSEVTGTAEDLNIGSKTYTPLHCDPRLSGQPV